MCAGACGGGRGGGSARRGWARAEQCDGSGRPCAQGSSPRPCAAGQGSAGRLLHAAEPAGFRSAGLCPPRSAGPGAQPSRPADTPPGAEVGTGTGTGRSRREHHRGQACECGRGHGGAARTWAFSFLSIIPKGFVFIAVIIAGAVLKPALAEGVGGAAGGAGVHTTRRQWLPAGASLPSQPPPPGAPAPAPGTAALPLPIPHPCRESGAAAGPEEPLEVWEGRGGEGGAGCAQRDRGRGCVDGSAAGRTLPRYRGGGGSARREKGRPGGCGAARPGCAPPALSALPEPQRGRGSRAQRSRHRPSRMRQNNCGIAGGAGRARPAASPAQPARRAPPAGGMSGWSVGRRDTGECRGRGWSAGDSGPPGAAPAGLGSLRASAAAASLLPMSGLLDPMAIPSSHPPLSLLCAVPLPLVLLSLLVPCRSPARRLPSCLPSSPASPPAAASCFLHFSFCLPPANSVASHSRK